jgi:UrcA family protein
MTTQAEKWRVRAANGIALAVLLGTAAAAPARQTGDIKVVSHRQVSEEAMTEKVSYADLDLTKSRGVRKLNARVDGAVSRVCFGFDYIDSETKANCREYAWNGAKPQIERAVTRAHEIAATGFSNIAPVAIVIALPGK